MKFAIALLLLSSSAYAKSLYVDVNYSVENEFPSFWYATQDIGDMSQCLEAPTCQVQTEVKSASNQTVGWVTVDYIRDQFDDVPVLMVTLVDENGREITKMSAKNAKPEGLVMTGSGYLKDGTYDIRAGFLE